MTLQIFTTIALNLSTVSIWKEYFSKTKPLLSIQLFQINASSRVQEEEEKKKNVNPLAFTRKKAGWKGMLVTKAERR